MDLHPYDTESHNTTHNNDIPIFNNEISHNLFESLY